MCSSQLILPSQICQWQQMKLRNITGSISYNDPEMIEIRDYCFKHAYVHLNPITPNKTNVHVYGKLTLHIFDSVTFSSW